MLKALDEYNYCRYTLPMLKEKAKKRKEERELEKKAKALATTCKNGWALKGKGKGFSP